MNALHEMVSYLKPGNNYFGEKEKKTTYLRCQNRSQKDEAFVDRKRRREESEEGLSPATEANCHEKMRVSMTTQEPPRKHVRLGLPDHMH